MHRGIREFARLLSDGPQAWKADALCTPETRDLYFTTRGGQNEAKTAKAICALCPVRDECLRYAVLTSQRYGIWGGLTELERRGLRKALVTASEAA